MSEVKVRITAQNETQTGFQAVLTDAKRTAAQVQQTFSQTTAIPSPGQRPAVKPFQIGDVLAENARKSYDAQKGALQDMLGELRNVRQGSQEAFDPAPPQRFAGGISSVLARFALIVGGATAVGRVIASAFEQANNAVKEAIGIQEQFNNALRDAGQASTIGSAISEFRQLNAIAEQTGKTLETSFGKTFGEALANVFQGKPGQLLARLGSLALGNAPVREIQANEQQQRALSLQSLDSSLNRQISNLKDIEATGGNREAAEILRIQQERKAWIEKLTNDLKAANVSDSDIEKRVGKINEAFAREDKISQDQKRLDAEREITKEREKQAAASEREAEREAKRIATENERIEKRRREIDQDIGLADAKLRGDKTAEENILQAQDMNRILYQDGSFEQASNFAATQAALRAQNEKQTESKLTGSIEASSLQRIGGFARNEFLDTRRQENPAQAINKLTKSVDGIAKFLEKNTDGLVLKPTGG